jgi:hypothetical protein
MSGATFVTDVDGGTATCGVGRGGGGCDGAADGGGGLLTLLSLLLFINLSPAVTMPPMPRIASRKMPRGGFGWPAIVVVGSGGGTGAGLRNGVYRIVAVSGAGTGSLISGGGGG